jgi:tetratricopeptide (TPR) repeat protein
MPLACEVDRMTRWALCGLLTAVLGVAPLAQAENTAPASAWANCKGREGAWTELRVSACSDVIKSGKVTGEDLAKAHYSRANAYLANGDYALAIGDYDRALEIGRDDPDALSERCWARALVGAELDQALSDCNAALRLKADDAETLGARGFTYMRLGLYKTAVLDYDAALKLDPENALHLFARGEAKLKAGDLEGGNADIAAARTKDAKVEDKFERYDEAGQSSIWVAMVDTWRAMMKWVY